MSNDNHSLAGTSTAPHAPVDPFRFDVSALPAERQLLAWGERVIHMADLVTSREQVRSPFRAYFDRYEIGDCAFLDCYSDGVSLNRSIARVSQNTFGSMGFHIFVGGHCGSSFVHGAKRSGAALEVGVLAVDFEQPFRLSREDSQHVNVFAPLTRVQQAFADPGVLHGRTLSPHLPSVQLIVARCRALMTTLRTMPFQEAHRHLDALISLILAAFGADMGLAGSRRALERAAAFERVRSFVKLNLDNGDLTPEYVIESLGLSRPSVYRLFQHEGGLGNYIQNLRLRTAANDLLRYPQMQVQDIAYSLGFGSASAFTRAFRRAFDIAPRDIRFEPDARARAARSTR